MNAYLYCYNDGVNYFDADGAKPEVVRNNITVDPGGSSAKAVTSASTSKSANTAVKQSRDAAIREANPEEWARSEEARKNAARRATKLTNRERIMLDNPEEAAKLRYKEYYRDVPTVGGLLPESYVCSLAYESYWDRSDGYFDGLWWQDREKLAEAAAMLRLEASRSGGIDIIDVLGRKRLDETNTKMYAIQALANASRSGTWDEQTLIALENSLFSQGRIYNNDTHTLSAADIDALITYEDGILFREFGNWLEGGGKYIIAGVTMIGMDYFVAHSADRIVDRLYPSNDSSTAYDILSNKTLTKHHKSTGTDNYVSPTKGNDAALKDFWSMNPNNVKTYPEGRIVGYLPNGKTINIHPSSTLGGTPTIEIYDPITKISIKIRY